MNFAGTDVLEVRTFVVGPLGTNCYLVYGGVSMKGVLIDPGIYDDEVKNAIREKEIDLLYIINTHGHADHIGGNAYFSAPIAIHPLDAPCLSDPLRNLSFNSGWDLRALEAERLLLDGDIVRAGGLELEVIHTPGHTPGSICLRCGSILFSGDTLFFEGIGRTDLPGGDHSAILKSIKESLFSLSDDTKVLPGHGGKTTIGHEKRRNPFLSVSAE